MANESLVPVEEAEYEALRSLERIVRYNLPGLTIGAWPEIDLALVRLEDVRRHLG